MPPITPEEVGRRLENLKLACRQAGLRMTPQRMEIYREVAGTGEHPDADTIFQRVRARLPHVSADTVYRTLASLEELGLVDRVDPVCGRARYDANRDVHHHFVCTRCGTITDVYLNEHQTLPLPEGLETFGSADSVHLQIRGTCHPCKNNQQGATPCRTSKEPKPKKTC